MDSLEIEEQYGKNLHLKARKVSVSTPEENCYISCTKTLSLWLVQDFRNLELVGHFLDYSVWKEL